MDHSPIIQEQFYHHGRWEVAGAGCGGISVGPAGFSFKTRSVPVLPIRPSFPLLLEEVCALQDTLLAFLCTWLAGTQTFSPCVVTIPGQHLMVHPRYLRVSPACGCAHAAGERGAPASGKRRQKLCGNSCVGAWQLQDQLSGL